MSIFEDYVTRIELDYRSGKATEYTYRSSLEILMESLAKDINASSDPKHIECGAPDFIVEKRKVPLGYVETKDIGEDLNKIEKSDQMKRYLPALHNLILTDYLEFRWYVNGAKKRTVQLAEIGGQGRLVIQPNAETNIIQLFGDFFATESPTVETPKELASRLAGVTHFIRDRIVDVLKTGEPSMQKGFEQRFAAFKELLLPGLKEEEFADLYAQTMTYGLFAARLSAPQGEKFSLTTAYQFLFGNKFLRRLFSDVSEELDEIVIIRPYLLDIVSLLNRADFHSILADFGKRTRTEDPVVHFYETFLAAYDPKLRESRGVYYTPEPVVQFIVNSVDHLLKTRFGLAWGLADSSVKVLDPATGTGTFLYYVIQKIHEEVVKRNQAGQWKQKSKELLSRVFGFELLIAPYVVSHLKLGLLLKTLNAPLEGKDERLHVYLTNTLEEGVTRAEQLAGLGSYIAEEASDASHVKKQQDIMVVLGNPPYSGTSANKGKWIDDLIHDYFFVDGAPLGERNPKWLLDDYVKFIRFGEWRIDKTGHGILAYITNHGYLDNPTFRGMRQHLMDTFNEIYILDLHGNSKKKEHTPDGGKDENVFDIQQGVAIVLAVKFQATNKAVPVNIKHANLWGLREEKYAALHSSNVNKISWSNLQPEKPYYLFIPQDKALLPEYMQGIMINEIFDINSVGFQTHRDYLVISSNKKELVSRINDFISPSYSTSQIREKYFSHLSKGKYPLGDTRDWQLEKARVILQQEKNLGKWFTTCLRRPFDIQHYFDHNDAIDYGRPQIMNSIRNGETIAFLWTRPMSPKYEFSVFVSDRSVDQSAIGNKVEGAGGTYVAPLYHYTVPEGLFAQIEATRRPNFAPAFIGVLSNKLGMQFIQDGAGDLKKTFGPEDVFFYAYAVFHSPTYRVRYAEFLKMDFPRLPLTSDKRLFTRLVARGKGLVDLHLLRSPKVDEFITSFPEAGDNRVERVAYANKRVSINDKQYFGNVPADVWEFKIGGYQVCEKWLKDRKGRVLSSEDITHYQRVVVALKETIGLMKSIDKDIPKFPIE